MLEGRMWGWVLLEERQASRLNGGSGCVVVSKEIAEEE